MSIDPNRILGVVEDEVIVLPIRPEWVRLPSNESGDPTAAVDELAAELTSDEAAGRGLRIGLTAVIALARRLAPGPRRSYALVRSPESGWVDALLTFRLVGRGDVTVDRYFAGASAPLEGEGIDVVNRTVERVRLPAGEAVVSHDFTLAVDGEGVGNPALERAFLALFPDGMDTVVEFSLLTQNLALFDDAALFLVRFAAGENPETPDGGQ